MKKPISIEPKIRLTALALSVVSTVALAQAPVELTSITRTTNGVAVAWTDPAPGYAYTVQVRESLTGSDWRNAITRYRWPWPFASWGDAPRNLPGTRFYRVIAEPITTPNRGKLLTNRLRDQFDINGPNGLNAYFSAWGVSDFVHPRFGTINRPFTYETIDPYGMPITASALLILPKGTNGPMPMITVEHGTKARKIDAPSQSEDTIDYMWGVAFASYGYAVVMPDNLGLGMSPGYQAYLHVKSEATCVVDALRAARMLCTSNHVTLNGQLFLTGYSQGGQVTMAAHCELETLHAGEFTVTASAPGAGPYDLGGVQIEDLLADPKYPSSWYFSIVVASWLPIYRLGDTVEELLAEPYRRTLPPLLDGTHDQGQLAAAMPVDMFQILRPNFQADFRTNVNNPLRQAFLDNNTYAWTPKAPVRMFHCRGDRDVVFANAEVAYQSFTNRGACCVSIIDPGAPAELDHNACVIPSLRAAISWFETLRQ